MSVLINRHFGLQCALSQLKRFSSYIRSDKKKLKGDPEIFTKITKTYENMGTLGSFGLHHSWHDALANMAVPDRQGMRMLDAAGGQGAIARGVLNLIKNTGVENNFRVTVCDVNTAMMDYGKELLTSQNLDPNLIEWVKGSVENLPFSNETFNVYTISMGFRYVDIDKTLAEAYRVLKPGSRFYCMDTSNIDNYFIARIHSVLHKTIPYIGYAKFKTWEPFSTYANMASNVPTKEKLKEMVQAAGFSEVAYKSLSFGWCAIHSGRKL